MVCMMRLGNELCVETGLVMNEMKVSMVVMALFEFDIVTHFQAFGLSTRSFVTQPRLISGSASLGRTEFGRTRPAKAISNMPVPA
jgi:hypothetical protein